MEEKRIYCIVAGTIQVPLDGKGNSIFRSGPSAILSGRKWRTVLQPQGRQIAQACHVVSLLRLQHYALKEPRIGMEAVTTIILQGRDSAELGHVYRLLHKKKLKPEIFSDTNPEYGLGEWPTAVAALASYFEVQGILDYLPLWGS
jgi:hypothetical protein